MDTKDVKSIHVKLLSGPISLTHHISTIYDKNVYVFGEVHDTKIVCVDFKEHPIAMDKFFDSTIKGTSKMIDIYRATLH